MALHNPHDKDCKHLKELEFVRELAVLRWSVGFISL